MHRYVFTYVFLKGHFRSFWIHFRSFLVLVTTPQMIQNNQCKDVRWTFIIHKQLYDYKREIKINVYLIFNVGAHY